MRSVFYKIGINTLVQAVGKVISVALGFLSVGLLTRYLGQEGFGNFSLVFAYLSIFGVLGDFGLQLTMVRELAKQKLPPKIYGTYFWLKLFLVVLSTILAIFLLLFFPYSSFLKLAILIASLGTSVGILNSYGTVIFQVKLRLDLVTLVDVVAKLVTTGLLAFFIFTNKGFYSIINTVLIGNLAGSLIIAFLVRKFIPFNLNFDLSLFKEIFRKSLPVGLISIFTLLYFKIDTLILSLIRGAAEVGIYSLAYKVLENILVFWGFYMATVFPLLASFSHRKKTNKGQELMKKSIKIALGFSGVIIIFGFIFAPLIIKILGGEEFQGSISALKILLFSIPLFFINNLYFHSFIVKEKMRPLLKIIISSLFFNLVLNLIFIPRYGYLAAAFVTLFVEVYRTFLYLISSSSSCFTNYEKR